MKRTRKEIEAELESLDFDPQAVRTIEMQFEVLLDIRDLLGEKGK